MKSLPLFCLDDLTFRYVDGYWDVGVIIPDGQTFTADLDDVEEQIIAEFGEEMMDEFSLWNSDCMESIRIHIAYLESLDLID